MPTSFTKKSCLVSYHILNIIASPVHKIDREQDKKGFDSMNEPISEKSARQVIQQSGQFSLPPQPDIPVSAQSVYPQNRHTNSQQNHQQSYPMNRSFNRQAAAQHYRDESLPGVWPGMRGRSPLFLRPPDPAAKKQQMKRPVLVQPDLEQPELKQSELKRPGLRHPELRQPGLRHPELRQPGLNHPGLRQPGLPAMKQSGLKRPGLRTGKIPLRKRLSCRISRPPL